MSFKVYYAKAPVMMVLREIDMPLSQDTLPHTHRFVKKVDTRDRDEVFTLMQGENWSPNGEARELISSLGLHHTSMSIGDVAEGDNGVFWMCAERGWKEVPPRMDRSTAAALPVALSYEIICVMQRYWGRMPPTDYSVWRELVKWRLEVVHVTASQA